jgi:hypothetical protein
VKKAITGWEKTYRDLHRGPKNSPILSYLDGGTFLMIFQRRHREEDMTHRLTGLSREIYLFCEKNRPAYDTVKRFPSLGEEKVLPFLNMMVDKKLMFKEGERYLSLAVPARGYRAREEGS